MFIDAKDGITALRQEGHVYRRERRQRPPSVRRAMSIVDAKHQINIVFLSEGVAVRISLKT
jgi:hypothetical protein